MEQEKIYGITRESDDMDYYWRAFISDLQMDFNSPGLYQRVIDYARIVRSAAGDSLSVTRPYLAPSYVPGLPATVYCPDSMEEYDGIIRAVDMVVDMRSGASSTIIKLDTVYDARMPFYDGVNRRGISPDSGVDMAINESLNAFYGDNFYETDGDEITYLDGRNRPPIEKYVDRDVCSMRDYLRFIGHTGIDKVEGHIDISGIPDICMADNARAPEGMNTYVDNAKKRLTITRGSDIYIRERYEAIKGIAASINSQRIIMQHE